MENRNLAICRDCGNQVSRSARTCPKCGRRLNQRETPGSLLAFTLKTVVVVLLVGIIAVFMRPWFLMWTEDSRRVRSAADESVPGSFPATLGDGSSPAGEPMLTTTWDDFGRYMLAADRIGLGNAEAREFNELRESMTRDGRLFHARNGVRVTVLRGVDPFFEVQILEGDHAGRVGWVSPMWINRR
jgi:hypothetical protein